MIRDPAILGKLFGLTRGDLERARFPLPNILKLADDMAFVRLRTLSAFWKEEAQNQDGLRGSVSDLLTGLYSQGSSCAFAIQSDAAEIGCWFGSKSGGDEEIGDLLTGVCPEVRLTDGPPRFSGSFRHAILVTGRPATKCDERGAPAEQIDRVVRGLRGRSWLYFVRAEPLAPSVILKIINDISDEIRGITSTYLLKQSAIDESDRTVRRYIELLEAKLQQHEHGRSSGMWRANAYFLSDSPETLQLARGLLGMAFGGVESTPEPIRCCACSPDGDSNLEIEPLSTPDVAVLVCPPWTEHPGYGVVEHARYGVDLDGHCPKHAFKLGRVVDGGKMTPNWCWIEPGELTKHVLVAGVTGSGKTNTCVQLLSKASENGVPCLVIESAKSEYRALLPSVGFAQLAVFTLGNETVAPFRLNPFEVPSRTLVQTHIDYIKSLFSAAFVLYPPMPYVLERSIQEIYEECGWDVADNKNRRGAGGSSSFPTLSDLAARIPVVVDRMGYDQRMTMDVKAGLLARIDQLRFGGGKGLMLDTRTSVPDSVLFEGHCLLELKSLVSDDEKAFLIGLVLVRLYEHCEARESRDGLRHLTLIEEAHRLLRNTSTDQTSDVSANPRGRAIEVFSNILAEIRAYGEGIALAEQSPTKLIPDAIKNTNLKIIHRLVAADDRALVGSSMHLDDRQQRRLALLETGDCVVFREGLLNPVLIRVPRATASVASMEDAVLGSRTKAFYSENPRILDPLPSCGECPNYAGLLTCRQRGRPTLDPVAEVAFRRFFNDLRFAQAGLSDSYSNLQASYKAARSGNQLAFNCAIRHFLHGELDRRAKALQWSFDWLAAALSHGMNALIEVASATGTAGLHDGPAVRLFARILSRIEHQQLGPFVGCIACRDVCRFRLDVTDAVTGHETMFRGAFRDRNVPWTSLIEVCRNGTADAVPQAAGRIRHGAALCFAVQQFARLGLTSTQQRELSERMSEHLTERTQHGSPRAHTES